jgi:hypothetical protein
VLVGVLGHQQPPDRQVGDDLRVGVLDEPPVPRRYPVVERGVGVDGVEDRQVLGPPDGGVLLAERRGDVDDARPVVVGHVVGRHHPPGVLAHHRLEELERPLVAPADHVRARPAGRRFGAGVEPLGRPLAQHQVAPAGRVGHLHIGEGRADGGGDVGDQGPRCGRPHQQVGVGRAPTRQREADVDRGVDHVLVALGHLVAAEGRAAPPAVGSDAVALVEQALVPELADEPPDRLDVVVAERPVGVGGVDPHAGAGGEGRPVLDVARDRLAAAGVEGLDAVGLDVGLGAEPQLLLDLQLDGQPVGVPPALAGDVAAPHGLEAGEQILEHPGPHVVEAGPAVGRGRPLVEDPGLATLAQAGRLLDDLAVVPAPEDALLQLREVEIRVDGAERHGARLGQTASGSRHENRLLRRRFLPGGGNARSNP